jgi:hypothetical protein
MTYWPDGIDWWLQVKDEPLEERHYLHKAALPLNLLLADSQFTAWTSEIPFSVRKHIQCYLNIGFTLLYHLSHYPAAYELFSDHPTLLWFLLTTARNEDWPEKRVEKLLSAKRKDILSACGQPGSDRAVKFLSKLAFDEYDIKSYRLIQKVLALPQLALINHHDSLNFLLIKVLLRFPELTSSAFLTHYHPRDWSANVGMLLNDTQLLAARLGESRRFSEVLRNSVKTEQDLQRLHDRLVVKLNHQSPHNTPVITFLPPLVPGNECIQPIIDSYMLAEEGRLQSHCVRTYQDKILGGRYYVYRVLFPERATLGLALNPDTKPLIDQLRLRENKTVSGSRYFCESLFWASQPQQAAKM